MDPAVATTPASAPPAAFEDGLGERRHTVGAGNEKLEVLRLNTVLSAVSSFEFALRERAGRLANFRHESYGRVRAVERLDKLASTLVVVSEHVPGVRLAELLATAERRSLPLEFDAARCLIRQLVSAVAALQELVPDICHGAIGPERIVVTPEGRLVIVEYVLGAALEQLRYSQERYWRELGVALPSSAGTPRFDPVVDVTEMGTVALALLLGRRLASDDYPTRIDEVVSGAALRSATGELEPMRTELREWILRALQFDPHASFATAVDARANLDFALGEADPVAESAALRAFVAACLSRPPADSAKVRVVPVAATPEAVPAPAAPAAAPASQEATPGLEALRSFLNRYPSRDVAERASAKLAAAISSEVASPAPPVSADPVPVSPASNVTPSPSPRAASPVPAVRVEPVAAPNPIPTTMPITTPVPTASSTSEPIFEAEVSEVPATLVGTWPRQWLIGAAIGLIVLTTGATLVGLWYLLPFGGSNATGTLVVGTNPGGVSVLIDGASRGATPISVDLPIGDHVLELVSPLGNRRIPVRMTAGGQVSQFIEMPKTAATLGSLQIRTDPARVEVTIDGQKLGRSPLTIPDLAPGIHTVVLENETGALTQQVTIAPGTMASLVVSMTKPQTANTAGWISITVPADVQVYEGQRLLGTNRSERIMLPVGRHELELVNEALGYRATRTIEVQAGQVSAVRPEWPQGTLAINALPWAEVWIDGERIGETPIGNVSVPIGAHEIVFRHPELGERRAYATVTLGGPARVGVDLRTK